MRHCVCKGDPIGGTVVLSDSTSPQSRDAGGDPACWLHLQEEDAARLDPVEQVVDLGARREADGELWSPSCGGDLEARLVRLTPGHGSGEHVDEDADVLVIVRSGSGELSVDGSRYRIRPDVVALVPRGCRRALAAGVDGLSYLAVRRAADHPTPVPAAANTQPQEDAC